MEPQACSVCEPLWCGRIDNPEGPTILLGLVRQLRLSQIQKYEATASQVLWPGKTVFLGGRGGTMCFRKRQPNNKHAPIVTFSQRQEAQHLGSTAIAKNQAFNVCCCFFFFQLSLAHELMPGHGQWADSEFLVAKAVIQGRTTAGLKPMRRKNNFERAQAD